MFWLILGMTVNSRLGRKIRMRLSGSCVGGEDAFSVIAYLMAIELPELARLIIDRELGDLVRDDDIGKSQDMADEWNASYPIGTPVRVWSGVYESGRRYIDTRTRLEAGWACENVCVWVDDYINESRKPPNSFRG